jgi:hypothetical protein
MLGWDFLHFQENFIVDHRAVLLELLWFDHIIVEIAMSLQDKKGWTRTEIIQAFSTSIAGYTAILATLTLITILIVNRDKILEILPKRSLPQANGMSPPNKAKSSEIGYVRIGAVNNQGSQTLVGQTLISTSQPVAISPGKVPSIGDQIKIITSVHARKNIPKAPDYNPPEPPIRVFLNGQKLLILEVYPIGGRPDSKHIPVWAKVQY